MKHRVFTLIELLVVVVIIGVLITVGTIINYRTDKYQNSFFLDSVTLCNDLGPGLRGAESLSIFKKTF